MMVGTSVGQSDNASIQANATVLTDITIDPISNLEFGEILAGDEVIVLTTDQEAGQFNISSPNNNTSFIVYLTYPNNLLNANSVELPVSFVFEGSEVLDDNTALFPVTDGEEFSTPPGGNDILQSIFVGGTVTASEDQAGGDYTEEIIITVEVL